MMHNMLGSQYTGGYRAPAPPSKQHFIVDYMIKDDSMQLVKTADNTYKLTFGYLAESPLTCSVFTFVEESFNLLTMTTEKLKCDPRYGCESHIQLKAGKDMNAAVPDAKVSTSMNYFFTTKMQNSIYPLMIRLVSFF